MYCAMVPGPKTLIFCAIVLLFVLYNKSLTTEFNINGEKLRRNDYVQYQRVDRRKSLLFMTAMYTFDQFSSLQKQLDCLRDICNAGWDVTVRIQSASGLNSSHIKYDELRDKLYCHQSNSYILFSIESFEKIGFGLNSKHRVTLKENIDKFDYFSYAEEDMLLTISHLNAYIAEQEKLKRVLKQDYLEYFIGFIRYEDSIVDTERVTWEYFPHQVHVVKISSDLPNYLVTNNLNQAIYIFSKEQLAYLESVCEFITKPGQNEFYKELRRAMNADWKYMSVGVSEWSSSFQQVLQCGMRRVIPIDHFQSFLIHHSTNKAQKRRLRKELLNIQDWLTLIKEKSKNPITIEEAYNDIIYHQYNLHLIKPEKIKGRVKWVWHYNETNTREI